MAHSKRTRKLRTTKPAALSYFKGVSYLMPLGKVADRYTFVSPAPRNAKVAWERNWKALNGDMQRTMKQHDDALRRQP